MEFDVLRYVYTSIKVKLDIAYAHAPLRWRMPAQKHLGINTTTRDGMHLICTISNVYITYEINKVVQLSILLLFENAGLPPDSSCLLLCDIMGQPERGPY